jgi:hypothetical protein
MENRISRALDRAYGTATRVILGMFVIYIGLTVGIRRWPYVVQETVVITPSVAPGGVMRMARRIDYRSDCTIHYGRMLMSLVRDEKGALRRQDLAQVHFEDPPWELDGVLQETKVDVPADFPCGPAQVVDSPSAWCNWFQRLVWPQVRDDALTRFTVAGGSCPLASN